MKSVYTTVKAAGKSVYIQQLRLLVSQCIQQLRLLVHMSILTYFINECDISAMNFTYFSNEFNIYCSNKFDILQ